MKVKVLILFIILSFPTLLLAKYSKPSRQVANYNQATVDEGKKIFDGFSSCTKIVVTSEETRASFLKCTDAFLVPTMKKSKKSRYSAWLFMNFKVEGLGLCSSEQEATFMDTEYDLVLCFKLNTEGDVQRGHMSFTKINSTYYIKNIKY